MNKTVIAPVIAVLALVFTAFTGIQVEAELQEQIVSGLVTFIAGVFAVYGIYKNHKK